MFKLIISKDGKNLPQSTIVATIVSLENLMYTNPVAFYELVVACRNPEYEIFKNVKDVLKKYSMIEQNGDIKPEIKAIVLDMTEGEGLKTGIFNPIKQGIDENSTRTLRKPAYFDPRSIVRYVRVLADMRINQYF